VKSTSSFKNYPNKIEITAITKRSIFLFSRQISGLLELVNQDSKFDF
jgi:hypothetical protein